MILRRGLHKLVKQRVVVHTKDDRSIRGVLIGVYSDALALAHPEYLQEAQPEGLPGEAVVPQANVSWLQIPGDA